MILLLDDVEFERLFSQLACRERDGRLAALARSLYPYASLTAYQRDVALADDLDRTRRLYLHRGVIVRQDVAALRDRLEDYPRHVVGLVLDELVAVRFCAERRFEHRAFLCRDDDFALGVESLELVGDLFAAPASDVFAEKHSNAVHRKFVFDEVLYEDQRVTENAAERAVFLDREKRFLELRRVALGELVLLVLFKLIAYDVVERHGRYRDISELLALIPLLYHVKGVDQHAVLVHSDRGTVGEHIDGAHLTARDVAYLHVGRDLEHGFFIALHTIYLCRELVDTEHIGHAVITDLVAAAEVLVRIVVTHTPADRAADALGAVHLVEDAGVTDSVFLSFLFVVERLGREHMSVVLGDEVGHVARDDELGQKPDLAARMYKVVVSIYVLEQMASGYAPDAARLSRLVERMRERVGLGIEFVVVSRLVDPDSPENDRRVIVILIYHLTHVLQAHFSPLRVLADVLPTRDLGEYHETQLVALVEEVLAVGIMRSTREVDSQLVPEVDRVGFLRRSRHSVSDVRIGLMTVETSYLEQIAVEVEAVFSEFTGSETRLVHDLFCAESRCDGIQVGIFGIPQLYALAIEDDALLLSVRGDGSRRNFCARRVRDLDRDCGVLDSFAESEFYVQFWRGQHVDGRQTHIFAICRVVHVEVNLAVNAAVYEVVDHAAERGYLRPLGTIDHDCDHVGRAEVDKRRDIRIELCITALVRERLFAVDVYFGIIGDRLEAENEFLALPACGNVERPAVTTDELIHLLVEVVVRYLFVCVRDIDCLERLVVEFLGDVLLFEIGGIFPTVIKIYCFRHKSSFIVLYIVSYPHPLINAF